jgi:hypothetical protein
LGVWGSSGSDVFVVGDHGTILHYDGVLPPVTTSTSITTTVSPTTISSTTTTIPPPLTLIEFNPIPGNRMVTLTWSTAREIYNAGFNIYRSTAENGDYIKVNNSFIPAHGSTTQGASYKYVDKNLKNRKTYYYKLVDINYYFNGHSTMHGPVSATPRWIYWILKK